MPKFYGNMGIWYSQPLLDVLVLAITVINLSKSYKKDLIIIQEKRK